MRKTNYKLKALCIEFCGSQFDAAIRARINPARLSLIINGHIDATARDLAALTEVFGAKALQDCELLPARRQYELGGSNSGRR